MTMFRRSMPVKALIARFLIRIGFAKKKESESLKKKRTIGFLDMMTRDEFVEKRLELR